MPKLSNIKMLSSFLEMDVQCEPVWLEFCKLDIRDLLFSIKGISSFEKVFKNDSSFFNKLFMKILLRG